MARYKDTDKLIEEIKKYHDGLKPKYISKLADAEILDIIDIINEQPTADVVEIVRCKDCVSHTHCFVEDHYNFVGIENPFCCVGKKVE